MNWSLLPIITGALVSVCALGLTLWKIIAFLGRMSRLHPVIMQMAEEFKNNTGSSLKDQIDRLEAAAIEAAATAKTAKEVAEMARSAASHQTSILETLRVEIIRQGIVAGLSAPPSLATIAEHLQPTETTGS